MPRTKQTARKTTGVTAPRMQWPLYIPIPAPEPEPSKEKDSQKRFLEFKHYKAWVTVDGQKAPCYAIDVDKKERVVSCWIPSEMGKEFSINFSKENESSRAIRVTCYVDTLNVGRQFFKRNEVDETFWDSFVLSKRTERPFMFAAVNLTDDDAYLEPSLDSSQTHGSVGELTLKVHHVTRLITKRTKKSKDDTSDSDDAESAEDDSIDREKIHERSKAGITMQHQAGLGEKRTFDVGQDDSDDDRYYTTSVYSEVKDVLATFIFRYRSLDVLRNSGIAPSERKEWDGSIPPDQVIDLEKDHDEDEPAEHEPEPAVPVPQELQRPTATPIPEPPVVRQESPDVQLSTMAVTPPPPSSPPSGDETNQLDEIGQQAVRLPDAQSSQQSSSNPLKRTAAEIDVKNEEDIKPDPDMDGVEDRKKAILAELDQINRLLETQRHDGPSPQKKIKQEPQAIAPVGFFKPGEVIDLT